MFFDYLEAIYNGDVKLTKRKVAELEKEMRVFTYKDMIERDLSQIVRLINFPSDLDVDIFNKICFREGMVGLYWDGNAFQTCHVEPKGLPRKDGRPNELIARYIDDGKVNVVSNLVNDKDIVLCYANAYATPDWHVDWFANILTEVDISMNACVRYSRYNPIIRVKNDTEKRQLEDAIRKSELGEIGTFIPESTWQDLMSDENAEPIISINDVKNTDRLQYLEHFNLGLTNRLYSLYGCPTSSTGKMAQQTEKEIKGKEASSWLVPVDILRQFKAFCKRANNLYGDKLEEELDCRFGSVLMHNYEAFIVEQEPDTKNSFNIEENNDENIEENNDENIEENNDENIEENNDENIEENNDENIEENESCVDTTDIDELHEELDEEINEDTEEANVDENC